MWFSVALMKFHWSGINCHVFNQLECRNCSLYIIMQKIAPQAKSEKYFQIWFFPRFGGKKWRRSEHAHVSYPGLFFRPPGFSPYMGREERRVQGLDYCPWSLYYRCIEILNSWPFYSLINKNLQKCWKVTVPGAGHLPSFFVPTPGNLPIFSKKKC